MHMSDKRTKDKQKETVRKDGIASERNECMLVGWKMRKI